MMQRIAVKEEQEGVEITIHPLVDEFKQKMLGVWVLFWTLIGIYLAYEIVFVPAERDLTLFMVVWFAFWIYLEIKTVKSYRYRKSGSEIITIKDDKFIYLRQIGGRGLDSVFDIEWIQEIKKVDDVGNSFFGHMSRSYWTLNNESLELLYKGKVVRFGLDLDENETQQVLGKIKSILKRKI